MLVRLQAVDLLYQNKAQAFLSTCIAPDARMPYRLPRAIPSKIVIPVFTTSGEVINAEVVEDCLREIIETEDELERTEASHAAEERMLIEQGHEIVSPTKSVGGHVGFASPAHSVQAEMTASKTVEWAPALQRGRATTGWPDSRPREGFLDTRHDPKYGGCGPKSIDEAVDPAPAVQSETDELVILSSDQHSIVPASVAVDSEGLPSPAKGFRNPLAIMVRRRKLAAHKQLPFSIAESPLMPLDCACLGYYHFNHKTWSDGSGWILRNEFMEVIERARKLYAVSMTALM